MSQTLWNEIEKFCQLLIENDFHLVYGGSQRGTMGKVAKMFLDAGKEVIGIRPKHYIKDENYKGNLTQMLITEDLFSRKKKLIELSQVLIALPGGIGTLDEITEAHCFANMYNSPKLVAIFNPLNFYSGLVEQYQTMQKFGFSSPKKKESIHIESNPEEMMKKILQYFALL